MWLWRRAADATAPAQCSTLPRTSTPKITWRQLTGWVSCSQRHTIDPTCAQETIQRSLRPEPSSESSRCQPIWLVAMEAIGRNGMVPPGRQRKISTQTRCVQATVTVSTVLSHSTSRLWRWLTGAWRESSRFSTSLTNECPHYYNWRTEWVGPQGIVVSNR